MNYRYNLKECIIMEENNFFHKNSVFKKNIRGV